MPNNRKKFNELLGEDILFFNKIDEKPEHRAQALEHEDACTCDQCQIAGLQKLAQANRDRLRLDKRIDG